MADDATPSFGIASIEDFSAEMAEQGLDMSETERLNADQRKPRDEPEAGEGEADRGAPDKGDADDKGGEEEEGSQRLPKGVERRFATLTRRLKETQERLDAAEGRRGGGDENSQPKAGEKPKLENFQVYEDYIEALADYTADKKFKALTASNAEADTEKEFSKRFGEGKKAFKDWDDVVTDDVQVSQSAANAIKATDNPAEIIYHLCQNPDEAERINALPVAKQALEIGKIEAKLEKASTGGKTSANEGNTGKRTTEAPDPITPLKSGGKTIAKTLDEMDPDDFIRARNKSEGIKRRY